MVAGILAITGIIYLSLDQYAVHKHQIDLYHTAFYPINEVVELLHCGRQKAVNTLRELQYAGLVEIQKQGCGKPNRIYPKSYEAVPNTDFKKSRSGTPED